jgi:hypothetical protein
MKYYNTTQQTKKKKQNKKTKQKNKTKKQKTNERANKQSNLSNSVELNGTIIFIPSKVREAVEIPTRAEGEPISDNTRGDYCRWADGAEVDEGEGGCGKECKQPTKEKGGK